MFHRRYSEAFPTQARRATAYHREAGPARLGEQVECGLRDPAVHLGVAGPAESHVRCAHRRHLPSGLPVKGRGGSGKRPHY